MSEKQYELKEYSHGLFIQDNKNNKVQYYSQSKASMNYIVDKLNELSNENRQLKEALKELKEIGDYQAMVIQESYDIGDEIDKKIAVLTEAKIESFQNGDEELLGKIKFSIQVLKELKEVILE